MKKLFMILAGLNLVSPFAYADNNPVSVRTYVSNGADVLSIQSNENNLTIYSVSVNRGNCPIQENDFYKSNSLRFGDEKKYYLVGACRVSKVKEIEVSTDHGTVTFTAR